MTTTELTLDLFAGDLREELEYRVSAMEETEEQERTDYGETDTLPQTHKVAQAIEDLLDTLDGPGKSAADRRWQAALRRIIVRLGVYREVAAEATTDVATLNLRNGKTVMRTIRRREFVLDGVSYEFHRWPADWPGREVSATT